MKISTTFVRVDATIYELGLAPCGLLASAPDLNRMTASLENAGINAVASLPPSGSDAEAKAAAGPAELLHRLGYPNTVPAVTRMRQRWATTGWRSYGLAVDACNVVAIEHNMSIGLHDVTGRDCTEILIRRAPDGLTVLPSFRKSPKAIPRGDLVYEARCGASRSLAVMAWLGASDVDAAAFQIGPSTTDAVVVMLGNAGQPPEKAMECAARVADLFAEAGVKVTALSVERVVPS